METITVVITTKNRPDYLARAINSVINQTFKDFYLYVVDDGDDFYTYSIIQRFVTEGLNCKYVKVGGKGLAVARNIALAECKTKYIAYLDDDDEWLPSKLEKQLEVVINTDVAVVTCGAIYSGRYLDRIKLPDLRGNIRQAIFEKGLNTIPSSCFFDTEKLRAVGGYDERFKTHVDHALWMKLAEADYTCDYVPEPLVKIYEDVSSRMTKEHIKRIETMKTFVSIWEGPCKKWYGNKKGENFIKNYAADKLISQAILALSEEKKDIAFFAYRTANGYGLKIKHHLKYWTGRFIGVNNIKYFLNLIKRFFRWF